MRTILASGSPRRRELLGKITEDFEVVTADVDEVSIEKKLERAGGYRSEAELAVRTVRELSRAKALAVFVKTNSPLDTLVIGADTVVALKNEILGKPVDREDAVRMLRAQSMEPQRVITGVTLILRSTDNTLACCSEKELSGIEISTKIRTFTEETLVYFKPLDEAQEKRIQQYCDTDEPYDKAGAYGIQLNGGLLVDHYEGDYDNIVGFPTDRVRDEISRLTEMQGCRCRPD